MPKVIRTSQHQSRLPHYLSREHIELAIQALKSGSVTVPKNRKSKKYDVALDGATFPPKYLICLAHKYYEGTELRSSDHFGKEWPNPFGGGDEANNFLLDRGFKVHDKHGNPVGRVEMDQEEESTFPEGTALYRLHKSLERDPALIAKAKALRRANAGGLRCDVCNFCFEESYGPIGSGFIEAHHTVPVHQIKGRWRTKIGELALVCSNCHRMLHRAAPISVLSLRDRMVKG